ncbi:hypothetical protein D3C81_1195870 [compost metagenome]
MSGLGCLRFKCATNIIAVGVIVQIGSVLIFLNLFFSITTAAGCGFIDEAGIFPGVDKLGKGCWFLNAKISAIING